MRLGLLRMPLCLGAAAAALCLPAAPFHPMPDAEEEAKLLPDGKGKELVALYCFECHDSGNFRKMRLSEEGWSEQIAEMVARGSKGDEAELDTIEAYLVKNFGKDSKVNVNTAPLLEFKTVLGLSVHDCEALIAYRTAHGNFKQWRDLAKVPDVDAKKIEDKKDLMTF